MIIIINNINNNKTMGKKINLIFKEILIILNVKVKLLNNIYII